MAPRKKTTEPVVVAEPAPEQPMMTYIPNPITVASMRPATQGEFALREVVRSRLQAVENVIVDFVREKEAEGFSLDEINTLYAVELPLLFGYWREDGNGRIRAQYDGQIVER